MNDVMRIVAAFLVWLVLFSAVYGLHGIGCSLGWSRTVFAGASLFRIALVTAAAIAILLQIAVIVALQKPALRASNPFIRKISTSLAVAALVAQVWAMSPVVLLSACL